MESSINQVRRNQGGNYILPFLWQHGEKESVLRQEVARIDACGIKAFCVEARPHPDFCGESWWRDMGILLEETKARGMQIWILDDAHFPTGYANGILAKKYPEHTKQYFARTACDVAGPLPGVTLDVSTLFQAPAMPNPMEAMLGAGLLQPVLPQDDFLCVAVASKVNREGELEESLDITGFISNHRLCWDVPPGQWKLQFVTVTRQGGGRKGYLNWMDARSAACQIEAVYQPHWDHFKEEFGGTIAGFFSDEPELGNVFGYSFDDSIGRKPMPLPYSQALCDRLAQGLGGNWKQQLPLLWAQGQDRAHTAWVRKVYMDAVSQLVAENFSQPLGDWCQAHGVEYIGHIIEDNNQHSRLGCSMGHFFRALSGQHMSGIDDIGNQVLFGCESGRREGATKGDGEFYHFALGKLGASLGHIDPKKQGRTLCEIFGAYGWGEGTRLMKWLTDHFLVRGVNVFVPHAFSPKEFPDPDCPPHFYAGGHNPLYPAFGQLMGYMNRMCHVLSNGVHRCKAAILYHGESEWMGEAMFLQKPARALAERQIDFDILPNDVFSQESPYPTRFDQGLLWVHQESYSCLILPEAEFLPWEAARFAGEKAKEGFPVYCVNRLPVGVVGGTEKENREAAAGLSHCQVIPLEALAQVLVEQGMAELSLSQPFPALRVYHYQKDTHLYFLSNESPGEVFEGEVTIPVPGVPVGFDAMENRLLRLPYTLGSAGCQLSLRLEPYESILLSMEQEMPPEAQPVLRLGTQGAALTGPWKVSLKKPEEEMFTLTDLTAPANLALTFPEFSGTARYACDFTPPGLLERPVLSLPQAFEFAEVWLNGEKLGSRICPPYLFCCGEQLRPGVNHLEIQVTNTLIHALPSTPNPFSPLQATEPSGLLLPPILGEQEV